MDSAGTTHASGFPADIAAGLRMVADAIDPPLKYPLLEAISGAAEKVAYAEQLQRDLAEMLARPKRPTPLTSCADCGRTGVPTYHCSAASIDHSKLDAAIAASARLHTGDPGVDNTANLVETLPILDSNRFGPCATCGSLTHLTIAHRATVPYDCGGCGACERRGDCVSHPIRHDYQANVDACNNRDFEGKCAVGCPSDACRLGGTSL